MIGYWNDDEDAALQGLSLEAQVIYLRGIRRFSDRNGIAGIERRINRASLSEVCHFLPERRSPRGEVRLSWDQVRRRLDELERAGLIIRRENLVFELPFAVTDNSARMKTTGRRHVDDTPLMTRTEALQDKDSNNVDDTKTTPPNMALDDTTSPVTIIKDNNNTAGEVLPFPASNKGGNYDHLFTDDDRIHFEIPLDWQPSPKFDEYCKGRIVNGRMISRTDLAAEILLAYVQAGNSSHQRQTQHQWDKGLAAYLQSCLQNPRKPKPAATGAAHEARSPAPRKLTPVQQVRVANGRDPDTGKPISRTIPGECRVVN